MPPTGVAVAQLTHADLRKEWGIAKPIIPISLAKQVSKRPARPFSCHCQEVLRPHQGHKAPLTPVRTPV